MLLSPRKALQPPRTAPLHGTEVLSKKIELHYKVKLSRFPKAVLFTRPLPAAAGAAGSLLLTACEHSLSSLTIR